MRRGREVHQEDPRQWSAEKGWPVATEIDPEAVQRLQAEGLSQREIARRLGIPRSTLHDHLKRTQAMNRVPS
jgi:DNA invertase Pin-like site-specific DNA recombinase